MNKKIKKISYPEKYNELISKYGENEGYKEYIRFIRGNSLEKSVLKYGKELGEIKYKEYLKNISKPKVTLELMIKKYGEELGKIKYNNWKSLIKQDLQSFIRRYGEKIGKEKYEEFKRKSLIPLSKIDRTKIPNPRKLEYWIEKCDGNIKEANIKLHEYQNISSLNSFIKRYGEIKGKEKYIEVNKLKSNTLENYIRKYGEVDGKEKYDIYTKKLKLTKTKQYIINKYGENYYKELCIKKINCFSKRYSIIGLEFCNEIYDQIKNYYEKIYYGDNEYNFFILEDDFKIICPDIYIKDINLVIEFYGDFWHKNPKIYENIDDDYKLIIWEHDKKRIDKLKTKYNCNIIIIWENDYRNDKKNIIKKVIDEIKKYNK